ncbi:MAG: DUF5119 domain-containing protein [Alistipes sp.]|nr:DUF5119 domain-containing protein [Alistipes sp.]
MSKMRYILLVALAALLSVACQRRPIEEQYLRVYLDLEIERNVTNYELQDDEPGLMRVAFFDAVTGDYLSHDFVASTGGYIHAPYGDVDMVVYNLEAGNTHVRNYYSWLNIEAYTDEVDEHQRSRFTRYLQSRVDTRPSYEDIRVTPGHLFVARERNIHIPQHITEDVFVIHTTAKSVVESWTIDIEDVSGMEWVSSVSMMLSGQVGANFIATNTLMEKPVALYFDVVSAQRRSTILSSRFETFGREKTSGDVALLSILFTDTQGHPYMYNFDVSDQMENNPAQHIVIKTKINIPQPEVGGGFVPKVDDWEEHQYDINI